MRKAILLITLFLLIQLSAALFTKILIDDLSQPLNDSSNMTFNVWGMGVALLIANLFVIAFVFFVMRKHGRSPFASYLVAPRSKELWITIATFLALAFWVNVLNETLDMTNNMEPFLNDMIHNPICIFTICLLGPISEEVCFRRGILGALTEKARLRPYALPISAAIFGIIHFNPAQILGAFILGLFFGWLYLRTHSLVLPILCHIINNSTAVVLGLCCNNTDAQIIDFFPNTFWYIVATGISVILTILLFILLKKNMPQSRVIDDYEQY